MDYTEVCLTVAAADTDRAAAVAEMAVPWGFYLEDYRDLEEAAREIAHIDLIDETLLQKDRTHSVLHLYLDGNPAETVAFLTERLTALGIGYDITTDLCREEDWANNWKQYFKPTEVGSRLLICPTWEQEPPTERKVLHLEPGAAFGTGTHDTTRLCLEELDRLVKPGDTVLDLGCGSGILAIATLLLGAESAVGVDIDPVAVKTACENGERNGFAEPALRFVCGDLADKVDGRFSLVVANIVADVILLFAPQVPRFLAPGGAFVCSGILTERAQEVTDGLQRAGLTVTERRDSGGWTCLVAR